MECPVGKNIKKIRESKGISQEQLGRAIGITAASVCRIETGVSDPSTTMLSKVAKALNCDPVVFFYCKEADLDAENAEAKSFWKRVTDSIKEREETRKDICNRIGIEGKSLLFWERNNSIPSFGIVLRLAAYLDVDVYWLMYGDRIPNAQAMRESMDKEYNLTLDGALATIESLERRIAELEGRSKT